MYVYMVGGVGMHGFGVWDSLSDDEWIEWYGSKPLKLVFIRISLIRLYKLH